MHMRIKAGTYSTTTRNEICLDTQVIHINTDHRDYNKRFIQKNLAALYKNYSRTKGIFVTLLDY